MLTIGCEFAIDFIYCKNTTVSGKKRTNQIKRFNLFFMVPLVGTLWGLPFPANGNPRQKYAAHIDEPSVLPRRRAKKRTNQIKRFNLFFMVPLVGVEPTRYRYHGILSPARLPIPPQRRISLTHSRSLPVYDNIS